MRVLLIQPSRYRDGRLDKRRRRWLLGMTLPYLAALVPSDIDVQIREEYTLIKDIACPVISL